MTEFERRFDELIREELTRRRLLRRGATGALSMSAIAYLAACGSNETSKPKGASSKVIPKGKISKTLYFANWPAYIDVNDKTKGHPTLDEFTKKYGTKVKYVEEINDNNEFFGKVRPEYAAGKSGGRDLHVVTDWLCARMKRLGYVQKLDKSEMPNVVKNIAAGVASPDFDPKREYSVPWQSGQVIVIWRADKVGKQGPADANELLEDKKLKGKVTFLSEMRDSVGSVLLADGIKPEDASKDQCLAAIDKLEKGSKDGQIRAFTGNEYLKDLPKGDSHAILGWSGDAPQLQSETKSIRYRQPEEGFMVFTDSMQIPVGAPHAFTAQKIMDFYYDPEVQAKVTDYLQYVPPVKGTVDVLKADNPDIEGNKLINPDQSKIHNFKTFSPEDEADIDAAFERAIGA